MKSIYKYVIMGEGNQTISIPSTKILSVEEQFGEIVVYALVDDDLTDIDYEFEVSGTGYVIRFDVDDFKFLGTVKVSEGSLMFHVFYREKVGISE